MVLFHLEDDMEYTDYKNRIAPDRYREVWISCEVCSTERWVRWVRVKKGQGRFCGRECAKKFQLSEGMKTRNKEHAIYFYDEKNNVAMACWREPSGKGKRTSYTHWLWEMNYGEVPNGYKCRWKDRNPKNAVIENVELVTPEQIGFEISRRLMGHSTNEEARKKMSLAHTGKSKWEGFIGDIQYVGFSKWLKRKIRERDNHICQICKCDLKGKKNHRVHHIDGDKKNTDEGNLILLCTKCHSSIHSKMRVDETILAFRSKLG